MWFVILHQLVIPDFLFQIFQKRISVFFESGLEVQNQVVADRLGQQFGRKKESFIYHDIIEVDTMRNY